MKLYKFRPLGNCKDYCRIKKIIKGGFHCSSFFDFNDMNEGVFYATKDTIDITLIKKKAYKICSFSGINALDSQLMWGHYANAGMGIAIEIEVKDCQYFKEVCYGSNLKLNTIKEILTHKSKEWEYEKEFRYLRKNEALSKEKYQIKKIIFGTPYRELLNYKENKKENKRLKKYLECSKLLYEYLQKYNTTTPEIKPKCYNFETKSIEDFPENKKHCYQV